MTGRPDDRSLSQAAHPAVRGPGLIESLLWVGGYHLSQMVAVVMLLIVLAVAASAGWSRDPSLLMEVFRELVSSNGDWLLIAMTGSATLGALFLILPIAFWRSRPMPRRTLGTQGPAFRHLVLLTGAVLPLGILSDELYRAAAGLMEQIRMTLTEWLPFLAGLDGWTDSISLIQQQTASTAYPLLLVIVGLGPAIGEEVIFRGVIGRGLIARRGVVGGVLLTSVLFAIAHLSPAHAVATLPIAIFLHIAYLATGSIWAPIYVHFLNNALSVTMMKFGLGKDVEVSVILLISSAAYVILMGVLLLGRPASSRGVFRLSWGPSVAVTTSDAAASGLTIAPAWFVAAAASGVLCFTCSFVAAAMAGI